MADYSHFPEEVLKRRNLAWKQWALAHEAVPFALNDVQRALLSEAVPAVHRAAEAVTRAFLVVPELRRLFGYTADHEAAVLADPGYLPHIPLGRMDSILGPGSVKFLEYNTDGTAGWHYSGGMSALWREREGLPAERYPLVERLVDTVLECWDGWSGPEAGPPRMALVDWPDVGTAPEQQAIVSRFRARGLDCAREDPSTLRFEGGRLVGSRGPLDLVYRRVVSEEVFSQGGRAPALVEAYRAGAFCCVGGFRTDPAWSKVLFAILSDPRWASLFDPADLPVLRRTIPWTRLVGRGEAEFEGRVAPLRHLALECRGRLVLKPARSYQGTGVTAGPLVSEAVWRDAVERAFAEGLWVMQEFLEPVVWTHPGTGEELFLQLGEFVLKGRWAGLMARVAEDAVINPQVIDRFLPVAEEVPWEKEERR